LRDADGLRLVRDLEDDEPAQVLLGLREWTVRNRLAADRPCVRRLAKLLTADDSARRAVFAEPGDRPLDLVSPQLGRGGLPRREVIVALVRQHDPAHRVPPR
jgi:hypothetical protein